ncbi:hypothetical protein EMIHUDRAFT_234318 [Emiliania huxleyi CCMP1516]|uniref:SET domain-containing protein n=4 Tax=Emiliania huxleyi TaxID=2903 RepID=A0A0D3JZM8_EMIH1|nr:hypothetical protein EMIHUDRAFT_234318 [Emiliania huxleyi CCMP1516]EOD28963.1 hypothetical protein EMIHUDRAFT_234318 [Emiliania huxleyi CCMP1516]|eukprot:XP_005781392.1 hypothetical protein EMIHUDRAFT_234318 [Emiliania huxleyi CCMP1516]
MALRPAAAIYHRFCFDDSGWGPLSDLFTSAMLGEASELERLVADTASPPLDAADAHGSTALHHAALSSSVAAVLVLLEAGADASARDATGATPLHVAAYNGRLDACKLLVLHGASVHARDEGGHTPLYDATFEASNRGACPCAADSSELQRGRTASFLRAVMAMPPHAAQAHVARSCEIAISARLQDALVDGGAGAFARLLRRCRRFVDARDYDGSTALHAASEAGDARAVRLLLEAAADVAATTNCGETALHFAAREGHIPVVAALLEAGADALAASRSSTNPVDEARRRSQRTADSGGGGAGGESVLSLLEARLAELLRELLSRPRWAGLLRGPLALHHCAEHLEQADAEAEVSAAPRPQWAEALGVTADGLARLSAALRSNVVWLPAAADAGGCGSGCYELRARRRIEGGEELSFSYLGLPATGKRRPTRAERREQLHERWGFWCECALCGSEGGDAVRVQASPASRKRVR